MCKQLMPNKYINKNIYWKEATHDYCYYSIWIHFDTIQDHTHLVCNNSFILFVISFSNQNGINKYLSVFLCSISILFLALLKLI